MVDANKSSRYVWAYEGTPGTAAITAAGSLSYEFGSYKDECGKWNNPFVENGAVPSWVYASRTPTLTNLETKFPTFSHVYCPNTIQFLSWMLKSPSDSDPEVLVETLDTGLTYPLTIRLEEKGGTNPMLSQAIGCYNVGLTGKAELGKTFLVESEFAWQSIEDKGDRDILTTDPLAPGGMDKPYNGAPNITYDYGGGGAVSIPEVVRADFRIQQDYEIVSSDEGEEQVVYPYKLQPAQLILSAIFKTDTMWDDYIDRVATKEIRLALLKHDGTSYIYLDFYNTRIVSIKKTGDRNKGHYAAVATILAEEVKGESDWFTEGGANYANHFKGVVA